ncbi:hypothetical protein BJ742DRAFT_738808 [Cladochytrium replicatum]|nr:hypothetical protein BJ742DRAFT_738808 [Cladochytrium replicatum]
MCNKGAHHAARIRRSSSTDDTADNPARIIAANPGGTARAGGGGAGQRLIRAPLPPPITAQQAFGDTGGQDAVSAVVPYRALSPPTIYKLRTCCLREFVRTEVGRNEDGERSVYRARKVSVSTSGIALVLRGRKYLLVEKLSSPAARYGGTSVTPSIDFREPGFYELEDMDWDEEHGDDGGFVFQVPGVRREVEGVRRDSGMEMLDYGSEGWFGPGDGEDEMGSYELERQESKSEDALSYTGTPKNREKTTTSKAKTATTKTTTCQCQLVLLKQMLHRDLLVRHLFRILRTATHSLSKADESIPEKGKSVSDDLDEEADAVLPSLTRVLDLGRRAFCFESKGEGKNIQGDFGGPGLTSEWVRMIARVGILALASGVGRIIARVGRAKIKEGEDTTKVVAATRAAGVLRSLVRESGARFGDEVVVPPPPPPPPRNGVQSSGSTLGASQAQLSVMLAVFQCLVGEMVASIEDLGRLVENVGEGESGTVEGLVGLRRRLQGLAGLLGGLGRA